MKKRNIQKKRAQTIARRQDFAENFLLQLSKLTGIPIYELLEDAIVPAKKKKVVPKKAKKVVEKKQKILAREPASGKFKKSPKTVEEIQQPGYRITSIFEEPIGENQPIEFGNFDGPEQDTNDYFNEWFDDLDVDQGEDQIEIPKGDSP